MAEDAAPYLRVLPEEHVNLLGKHGTPLAKVIQGAYELIALQKVRCGMYINITRRGTFEILRQAVVLNS
jgi:hypothetical protein